MMPSASSAESLASFLKFLKSFYLKELSHETYCVVALYKQNLQTFIHNTYIVFFKLSLQTISNGSLLLRHEYEWKLTTKSLA